MKKWLIFFFISIQSLLLSQNTEIGLLVGASIYTGDIEVSPKNFIPQTRPAVGIYGRQHFNDKWAVRALLAVGGVTGNEKKYPTSKILEMRGFSFKGMIAELALLPEWRPFSFGNVHFYTFAGLAATYMNPKSDFNELTTNASSAEILDDQNQKYPKIALSIPFGGGLHWFVNQTTALGAEIGLRKTFTDYIDGFSKAANAKSADFYFLGGLTFSKFFSLGNDRAGTQRTRYQRSSVNCPTFN